MLKSYLTSAFRHFRRHKLHSTINILGLALGIMVTLLALAFMLDELSFDTFHSKLDRLYRLNKTRTDDAGAVTHNAESSGLYGPTMLEEFPEVEAYVRYQPWSNMVLSYKDSNVELKENEALFVDNSFLTMFDFPLLSGNREQALNRPSTMVLTQSLANSLFGSEDPVGKSIIGLNNLEFEITGIVADAPRNSHIQYAALMSFSTTTPQVGPLNFGWMNNWLAQGLTTYILLRPGADPEGVRTKLATLTEKHIPERAKDYGFYLQPFREIYLNANKVMFHRMSKTGSHQYVYFFGIIAAFVLIVACVNYINISTSKAATRSREVGLRKSLGAYKAQLVNQFLGESWLSVMLATLVGLILLYFAVPLFNNVAGKSLPYELLWSPQIVGAIVGLIFAVSLVAGGYPAFILSAFQPSEVLKGSGKNQSGGNVSRHVLTTFQLVISIMMISATLLVYKQLHFVMSKDLGFDKDNVLVVKLTSSMIPKGAVIREEVADHSSVLSTSLSRMALGGGSSSTFVQPEGFPPDQIEIRLFPVDYNFTATYGIEMTAGRFFERDMASDSGAVIINQALVDKLGWDKPMEKTIKFQDDTKTYSIIGVVSDFNYTSLYRKVEPLVMYTSPRPSGNLSVRFKGDPTSLLSHIEEVWKKFDNRYPFQYYFVDDAFAKAYESDNKVFQIVIWFASLSIVIACVGLYGLVSFTIEQRTREFGIRKVLGASVAGLNFMVNRKFIVMVLIAAAISIPVVILTAERWLKTFAYRADTGAGIFLLAIAITMFVTLLAVSIQAVRAASINPARALRYE